MTENFLPINTALSLKLEQISDVVVSGSHVGRRARSSQENVRSFSSRRGMSPSRPRLLFLYLCVLRDGHILEQQVLC